MTHAMGIVDQGTGSMTEFVHVINNRHIDLTDPRQFDRPFYATWNEDIEHYIRCAPTALVVGTAVSGEVIEFDDRTWHRGVPATGHGWRWFGRVSLDTGKRPVNEIRTQTQVYLPAINEGW